MDSDSTLAPTGAPGDAGGPVGDRDRIVTLDFVRGVAVLGILFANIVGFGHTMLAYVWPVALPGGGSEADRWLWLAQFTFVDGKFRGLFTLLFGAGLCLFLEREWARGGTGSLQLRRLFWLALFGLLHFHLLFEGDILFLYALAGFAVLPMVHWSARTQLWAGLAWYLAASLLMALALHTSAMRWEGLADARDAAIARAASEAAVLAGPDYGALVAYRLREQSGDLLEVLTTALHETIPLILLGMALYRLGFFTGGMGRRAMLRWGCVGFIVGAVLSAAIGGWVMLRGFPFWLTQYAFHGLAALPRLPMTLGMAALLVLLGSRGPPGWLSRRLAAAGRMAFSNYILMSLVMALLFQGWAGGLFGRLDRVMLLPPVLLGCALMLGWSEPWLARFRYGPLEWLWRCLVYGRIFPMRKAAT